MSDINKPLVKMSRDEEIQFLIENTDSLVVKEEDMLNENNIDQQDDIMYVTTDDVRDFEYFQDRSN